MNYLFAAYAITWLVILGYVISLARRRRQTLREAETLTRALDQKTKAGQLRKG